MEHLLWGFALFGLLPLLLMLRKVHKVSVRANYLNMLVTGQAVAFICLSIALLVQTTNPIYILKRYAFVDSLGIYEVLIGSTIFLLAVFYARGYVRGLLRSREIASRDLRLFYVAFSFLLTVVVFAFFSNNLALFWIQLELTTLLSAVLIVTLNAKENILAALKYVFTASTAMLFSIIGLIVLFAMTRQATGTGTLNWDSLMLLAQDLSPGLFTFAFILIFVGFAAKAGIVPFHMWLPQAHAKAPSVISVLLSAVLLNIGIYGIVRMYAIAHQTAASHLISMILVVFGVLSIVVAAFSMLPRENAKKLIAFSSIEHMGFMLVGIGIGTPVALFWVFFHTLAHAFVKTQLFFSAGILNQQYGSNKFADMKGALQLQPLASWGMILGSIAILGIPLSPVFLSKLYILSEIGNSSLPVMAAILLLFLLVTGAFAAILIRTFSRTADQEYASYKVAFSMRMPMLVLFVLILTFGLYMPPYLQTLLERIVSSLGF